MRKVYPAGKSDVAGSSVVRMLMNMHPLVYTALPAPKRHHLPEDNGTV